MNASNGNADLYPVVDHLLNNLEKNFDTIHLDSRLHLQPMSRQALADGLALVHVRAAIQVPAGPLAGDSLATQTLLLERDGAVWRIRAFTIRSCGRCQEGQG